MNTQEWRQFADDRLDVIAKHNQYIVSDMLVADLERHGAKPENSSVLGGVFTRAAKRGVIEKQPTRQKSKRPRTVWLSKIYKNEMEG